MANVCVLIVAEKTQVCIENVLHTKYKKTHSLACFFSHLAMQVVMIVFFQVLGYPCLYKCEWNLI